eukprot:TRINITY_DN16766_c0_g1_i1.p1 TRINITY_DN16766_c0_g1~~TRINITY_DN16766_c0_g1_i1.p1  ORF type:complete len:249 (+),score=36.14 TRINITY_DN16766_c0_g1_i1:115-861(+)
MATSKVEAEVKALFERQVSEFQSRTKMFRDKTCQMFVQREGFREVFETLWNAKSQAEKERFIKSTCDTLQNNCPAPRHKYVSMMQLTCPEFFKNELINGDKLDMMKFMDISCDWKENDPDYPFHAWIKEHLDTFLDDTGYNIYEDFKHSRNRQQYTKDLCWEQRRMWVAHFALIALANILEEMSSGEEKEKAAEQAAKEGQEDDRERCARCYLKAEKLKRCGRCKTVKYCSVACQRKDWKQHKPDCTK